MEAGSGIKFNNGEVYLPSFPPKIRKLLRLIKKAVKEAVPKASEVISCKMPACKNEQDTRVLCGE